MALPDPHIAHKLLSEAPGPSPWWCRAPIPSTHGSLAWKQLDPVLMDSEGLPRLGLPMYVWFQVIDEGWMLLWSRGGDAEPKNPKPVVILLLNVDYLQPLPDLDEWLAQKPPPLIHTF